MSDVHLDVEQHLAGLEAAADRLAGWATEAGPGATVPSCPGWSVADLVAHQGRVHRWALAALSGADLRTVGIDDQEGPDGDAVEWLRAGATELLDVLRTAPDDLVAPTFLREAPPARLFWARRQHHETAVHALDALAAREGRMPSAADAWFGADVARDGIDELLVGFWPRRGRGPRSEDGAYPAVVATAEGDRWWLEVGPDSVRTRLLGRHEPDPAPDAVRLSGPALEVHLALWNRGGAPADPDGLLDRWRTGGAVG